MKTRTATQIRMGIERAQRAIDAGAEAAEHLEGLRAELAHATAVFHLLFCRRSVSDPDDNTWDYEIIPASEEVAYRKLDLSLQANKTSVEINVHSDSDYMLTILVAPNEHTRFILPFCQGISEEEFRIYPFRTKAEAELCLAMIEQRESNKNASSLH